MKLYKHKAICNKCNTQEFDGAWIKPDDHEIFFDKFHGLWIKPDDHEIWIYVCYRCIIFLVLDNC